MSSKKKEGDEVVPKNNRRHGIQVIGAGLGRTGTKSLQAALERLGYRTYHYPLPSHAKAWAEMAERKRSADDVIDLVVRDGFTATCDNPSADLYQEQMRIFPDAKVVLTVRDSSAKWASSWKVLMSFIEVQERPFTLSYPSFLQFVPFMNAWKRMRGIIGATHLGLPQGALIRSWSNQADPDAWLAKQYEAHNAHVISHVPADRLLVFNVKEGWGPLCQFLGKEVPPDDEPFPFVNESAELALAEKVMKGITYMWIPAVASVVTLATSACLSLWRRAKH